MKINKNNIEISEKETISWKEVETMKMHNEDLCLVLTSGKVIHVPEARPTTVDAAFRSFESFIKEHPHHSRKRKR